MKKALIFLALVFCTVLLLISSEAERKVYTTQHVNPHAPKIDAKLDDPAWEKVEWEANFIQSRPYEGKEPSQKTAFKILYDDENIYVAVRAYDDEPGKIEKRLSRRDNPNGDWVTVLLDSYYDHRTAFGFGVNAVGVKADQVISEDGANDDSNWDPIWYAKTAIDEQGWIAEMSIPLSQLRYGNKVDHVWGLQLMRYLFRMEETSMWQFIPRDASGFVSYFGELQGVKGIKAQRQVQLVPYTVGKHQRFEKEAGNPFATGKQSNIFGGLDGKLGVTSDLTLDFTINPDFGQVEADPSEVNLTAYETYFEEKRPFFIEGKNILSFRIMLGDGDFSSDTLFYTRRIGRSPQLALFSGGGEYVDMPTNTSILGAFKLTGKTKNGISIGVIDAVTAEEKARVSYLGEYRNEVVEPLTNYFGLRLQKDYNKGNTIIGALFTATNRSIRNPELDILHRAAYSGGLDFYHTWKNKTYFISANTVFSQVSGSTDAILRTQLSPLRYFQRPDAEHFSLDPDRTSLAGHGGTVVLGKQGSGHFQYVAGVTWRSPGLELNDMGYLRQADKIMEFVWVGYRIWKPFSIFRQFNISFNQWRGWDFSGTNIFDGGNINLNTEFKNYWSFDFGINRQGESLSSSALRGGPMLRWPGGWNSWCNMNSDNRKKLRFNFGGSVFYRDNNDSGQKSVYFGVNYQPHSALSLSISPSFSTNDNDLQYVSTKDSGAEKRYIFATIDQKTLGVTVRLNLSLTPNFSIQFYGQPFVSAGTYSELKHITSPRADNYFDRFHVFTENEISYDTDEGLYRIDENQDGAVDYTIGNPNFNFLQFRSNLVLRWEYVPGSVLYLVWSQGRTDVLPTGDFSFIDGIRDLFSVYPHNVFLVKLSYSFSL